MSTGAVDMPPCLCELRHLANFVSNTYKFDPKKIFVVIRSPDRATALAKGLLLACSSFSQLPTGGNRQGILDSSNRGAA